MPILLEFIRNNPNDVDKENNGLQAIWISPIRSLAKEIKHSSERAIDSLGLNWKVGVRSGDTSTKERKKQKEQAPEILITTPESLHILMASKGYKKYFKNLKVVVADEWHEMVGSKRGVQLELAYSRFKAMIPELKIWGISATIGNMEEAFDVLMGEATDKKKQVFIKANIQKKIEISSLLPDEIEYFPWAGHLGIKMLHKIEPILQNSKTTLIFTNTRSQCEIWYQKLLDVYPDLAGQMAMHHGSVSKEIRTWVENALHEEKLKVVVATSSLDLGVDFRPVESIIQIGSPKGVARFLQRAGRSGHQPGATSRIYFVPTHSLELVESSALQKAIEKGIVESRIPYIRSFDVLIQYMLTLAVSEGFDPEIVFQEIKKTFSYKSVTQKEWDWILRFLLTGGVVLHTYDEYKKIVIEEGLWKVTRRKFASQHRLSIGTIVGDTMMVVKYLTGGKIGAVEEWFISQFKPGDSFWFAGRCLELVRVKEMTVLVRKSRKKKGRIPAWLGGRLPLSTQLAEMLRFKIDEISRNLYTDPESKVLNPLMDLQRHRSYIPKENELLVEYFESKEGYHLVVYPFEGRFVHQGLGSLLAYRIAKKFPISFSIAMNDYGFELLSDQKIDIEKFITRQIFSSKNLKDEIEQSLNLTEMAKRAFRDIAAISGLVFKGYPGKMVKDRHLQASAQMLFSVFQEHEMDNLLLQQAFDEVRLFQLEEHRIRLALERIQKQKLIIKFPVKATPFAFPLIVDRLRERLTSESLESRIKKMTLQLLKD